MSPTRFERAIPAALTLGLALSLPPAVYSQAPSPSNAPLSSGSGSGTGTGQSTNLGTSGNRVRMEGIVPQLPQNRRAGAAPSLGPGVGTTFPGDPSLVPFATQSDQDSGENEQQSRVRPLQFQLARQIAQPGDRSLALQRIANASIFSGQLDMAHQALAEAGESAVREPIQLVRDQRLISIVTSLNTLAEADLREGKTDLAIADAGNTNEPLPRIDRVGLIGRAQDEWRRAAYLAGRITSYTYRNEMLYRVVDNEAYGSQTIANEFPRDEVSRDDRRGARHPIDDRADQIMIEAATIARGIERPVWRDRALVSLATAAAQSEQFARGLEMARMIPPARGADRRPGQARRSAGPQRREEEQPRASPRRLGDLPRDGPRPSRRSRSPTSARS